MASNKVHIILISSLIMLLGACNNNDGNKQLGNGNNQDDSISSISTNMSSQKYPHTIPVEVQKAKYEFRVVYGQDGWQRQQVPSGTQKNESPQQKSKAPAQTQQQKAPAQPKQQKQQKQQQNTQTQQTAQTQQTEQATGISQFESKVIELTNVQRSRNGLPALQADTKLSGVAREKSNDMQTKNYFSHTSPTYGSPFDMMRDFGITYTAAGENIAQGQRSPDEVVQAWMNSEGHRKNILSGNFTHIGVGYSQTGNYWTQMFIRK